MDNLFSAPGDRPASADMVDIVGTLFDDRARQVALAVQQATGINRVLLFGSRARGDYGPASDVDLLVVHPEDRAMAEICQETAQRAVQDLYDGAIRTDVVMISPELFASAQFGLNHVAAKAVKDGVTPMGYSYRPSPRERPPRDPFTLESMERALHARGEFRTLQRLMRPGETEYYDVRVEFDLAFGRAAQGTLEHALKALIASRRAEYARIHNLVELQTHAMETVPEFQGLKSPLPVLSLFAGGAIYGTPHLEQDIEELFALLQADVEHVFALIRGQGSFAPWQVRVSDFQY